MDMLVLVLEKGVVEMRRCESFRQRLCSPFQLAMQIEPLSQICSVISAITVLHLLPSRQGRWNSCVAAPS